MRRSALACLIVAALGFGVLAQAVSAAPLRVVDLGPVGDAPQTGGRWIAWAEADGSARAVSRVDVLTAARSRVAPDGCRYIDMDTDGDLLFTCVPNDVRVLDSATGEWSTLPSHQAPTGLYQSVNYSELGHYWVKLIGRGEKGEASIYVRRSTGEVFEPRADGRHQIDLDRPELSRALCRGFRRPRVGLDYGGTGYDDLVIAGRWAATTTYQDRGVGIDTPTSVQLQRCGRPIRMLAIARRGTSYSMPVIGRRFVAWVTHTRGRSRVHVVSLKSGLRRAITVPTGASLLLAAERLYVAAAGRLLNIKV